MGDPAWQVPPGTSISALPGPLELFEQRCAKAHVEGEIGMNCEGRNPSENLQQAFSRAAAVPVADLPIFNPLLYIETNGRRSMPRCDFLHLPFLGR